MKTGTFMFHKLTHLEKTYVYEQFGVHQIPSIRAGSHICEWLNASYGDLLLLHHSTLPKKKHLNDYGPESFLKVIQ